MSRRTRRRNRQKRRRKKKQNLCNTSHDGLVDIVKKHCKTYQDVFDDIDYHYYINNKKIYGQMDLLAIRNPNSVTFYEIKSTHSCKHRTKAIRQLVKDAMFLRTSYARRLFRLNPGFKINFVYVSKNYVERVPCYK